MGDPKKQRKKYSGPSHPWQASRIEEERVLIKEYGLKNKKEIWKATSFLRKLKGQAKKLISSTTEQARIEEKQLLQKLARLGILPEGSNILDILNIDVYAILDRRLQSRVYKKDLARTIQQARQFITHGHILVNENKVNIPSYMVSVEEDNLILFTPNSPFKNEEHPERIIEKKEKSKIVRVKKKETDRIDRRRVRIEKKVEAKPEVKEQESEKIEEVAV